MKEGTRVQARRFLIRFFNDEELNNLSFDYFPFVYDQFAGGMTKGQKARLVVDTCQKRGKLPDLLAALKRERPDAYDDHFAAEAAATPSPLKPIQRNPRQIFLSHASEDADFAYRLAQDLRAHGWEIWMAPDSIRPGEKWVEAINRGLTESGIFVAILTATAVSSRWVQSETNAAIHMEHRGEIRFLPLAVEPAAPPPLWQAYQWIPFQAGYGSGFKRLLAALRPQEPQAPVAAAYEEPAAVLETAPPDPARSANEDVWVHPKTGITMVRVPAGEFLYGDDKETVYLDAFWVAKTPVTNAQYAHFVAETENKPPEHWQGNRVPSDIADHPVVNVSWHDAQAYAEWAEMALPTEQQWEKAARGTDGRKYPWGDEWRENHANTKEAGIRATTPVGQFSPQGDSPYGCVDMSGNVWEWTASKRREDESRRVLRGGSWLYDRNSARAASRRDFTPVFRSVNFGFRVVCVARRPPSP